MAVLPRIYFVVSVCSCVMLCPHYSVCIEKLCFRRCRKAFLTWFVMVMCRESMFVASNLLLSVLFWQQVAWPLPRLPW